MKRLDMLLVIALLGVGVAACSSANKGTRSTSRISSSVGSPGVTTASTSTKQTTPPQNDDYIQTYGREASAEDKQVITNLVKRYYAAAVADDGATACSLIYLSLARAIPEDYGRVPGPPALRGKTCTAVMSKLFKHVPGQPTAVLATTKVTGVRLNGDHGFVQLSSSAIPTGEIFVEREAGIWKIGVPIGRACTRCAAG